MIYFLFTFNYTARTV